MRRYIFIGLLLLAAQLRGGDAPGVPNAPAAAKIEWQDWTPSIFDKAKAEKKFVLLNLRAVWCHWCHVMDEQTYSDPKVIALIQSKYIPVSVDQDSRPDLANRYEDYGWPATVVFSPEGGEIVKQRGYIAPEKMISLLQAIIDDPTPGPSVTDTAAPVKYSADAALSDAQRKELQDALVAGYDNKEGSWGTGGQKYLDWDNVEYCIARARGGDARFEKMAKQTLAAQWKLIDPVWGGVYQYSTDGDWNHPHFEKLIQFQAEDMRIYALAEMVWHDHKDLEAAESIRNYIRNFLTSPDGAFYTSQDADLVDGEHAGGYFKLNDAQRRAQGVPRVDTHIYGRENGWMISALVRLYAATGDSACLDEALRAMKYMGQKRFVPTGAWRHDASNDAGPFLGDTLYMGRAMLDLYAATGSREWLYRALDAEKVIADRCMPPDGSAGVVTTAYSGANMVDPRPEFDENIAVARFANLMAYYTDDKNCRQLAECAMRYLVTPGVVKKRGVYVGGVLLADEEMKSTPLHIVVVGSKSDETAKKLFAAAVRYPVVYKQVEWQDRKEDPLHGKITFPDTPQAAAYVCTNNTCSSPILKPEEFAGRVDRMVNKPKTDAAQAHP